MQLYVCVCGMRMCVCVCVWKLAERLTDPAPWGLGWAAVAGGEGDTNLLRQRLTWRAELCGDRPTPSS